VSLDLKAAAIALAARRRPHLTMPSLKVNAIAGAQGHRGASVTADATRGVERGVH
jgi:hypothetical protein